MKINYEDGNRAERVHYKEIKKGKGKDPVLDPTKKAVFLDIYASMNSIVHILKNMFLL